jgi:hypothetical protein
MQCIHPTPSLSIQLELSKSTTITCLQNVGNTSDKLIPTFAFVEQDLEFWNSFERFGALRNMLNKYEKGHYVVTHIGGHQFSNLTNYNINLLISNLNVVVNLLFGSRGPPCG